MSKAALTSFSLRPCISANTELDRNEFMHRVQHEVESSSGFQGKFRTGHAMISIIESKRHFWSPWMHLEYRESQTFGESEHNDEPENETTSENQDRESEQNVVARFSPHPSIWTGFMLSYLALVVLVFFSIVLGYSQQLAQQSPWGYYVLPAWFLIGLGLWVASQIGQRWAENEMRELIEIVEGCLEE